MSGVASGPRWRLSAVEAAQLQEAQMLLHARAPLSPIGRRRVVDRVVVEGWSVAAASPSARCSGGGRGSRAEGQLGLVDRRPIPRRLPRRTPIDRVVAICELRRLRLTAAEIAERLEMPLSTVSAILKREGLGKRSRLEPPEPVRPTSASGQASSSTSTSRSSAGSSAARASGSPAGPARGARRRAPTRRACGAERAAGNAFTSPSTTSPAWPTSRCSPTSEPRPRSASSNAHSRSSAHTASGSSGS